MTGDRRVDLYLAAVEERLPGPPRWRRDLLDELRDGLHEAAAGHHLDAAGNRSEAVEQAVELAIQEFGPPQTVSSALAAEVRLRLVRRAGLVVFGVLTLVGLAWQVYRAVVGFSPTIVPDTAAAPLFLASIDVIVVVPAVAQIAALLLVVATSVPHRSWAWNALLVALAAVTFGAIVISVLAFVAATVTIAPGYQGTALLLRVPTAGLLVATLLCAHGALRHLRARARQATAA